MKYRPLEKVVAAGVAMCIAGCATAPGQNGVNNAFTDTFNNPDPCSNNARNAGMVIGGVAAALIAAKVGDNNTKKIIVGTLIGSAVGAMVGANIDKRRCDLAKVARDYQLQMSFAAVASDGAIISDTELDRVSNSADVKKNAIGNIVSLQDDSATGGHFDKNSDVLTPRAEQYFSAISDIYNQKKFAESIADTAERQKVLHAGSDRKLLLVGHTDDTGESSLNAELSERRARAVAQYLEKRGIPKDQVYYQGAGEVYPVADNNSDAGRAQNRRVEIVELTSAANFSKYLEARRPNYQFYRATPAPATVNAAPQAGTAVARGIEKPASRVASASQPAPTRPKLAVAPGSAPGAAMSSSKSAPVAQAPAIVPAFKSTGKPLDFGGTPLTQGILAAAGLGKLEQQKPLFSLISNAYADDVAVMSDCSRDRPRITGAVRALRDGATYKIAEHVPGLYGKSWTERVNGHQIVINKVAVLASEASLAQFPELKVYANYNPAVNRNPKPDVSLRPGVNTYLGEGGILYRIFTNGAAGMQCVDILYPRVGGSSAKGGNIIYSQDNRLYVSAFKPVIAN